MVRPGWRGDSYRHYLAAKGVKTANQVEQRRYNSQAFDIVRRGLRKAVREEDQRIEKYGSPGAVAGFEGEAYKSAYLGKLATQTPLTEAEKARVQVAREEEIDYLKYQNRFKGVPQRVRMLRDPLMVRSEYSKASDFLARQQQDIDRKKAEASDMGAQVQKDVITQNSSYKAGERATALRKTLFEIKALEDDMNDVVEYQSYLGRLSQGKASAQEAIADPRFIRSMRLINQRYLK